MDHIGPLFFVVGDIWPNLTLCVTGELWPFESIIDLRVWLGWSGASTVRWILQTAEVCCFLRFCQQTIDGNHLKFWVSQVRVLYNISDFLLKPPPKQGNNNIGSVTIFYFFPPCWFSEDVFFFCLRKKWRFLVALLLWHGPSAHPVLCGDL